MSNDGVNALFAGGQNNVLNPQSPIYVAQASSLTNWSAFGFGLPNAIVDGLSYNEQGNILVVATLGRGVYALYDVTSYFPTATVLNFGSANNDSLPNASQLTDGVDANGSAFSRGLLKSGTGTLTLAVPSTYTGPTTVNGGTMLAAAPGVRPASAFVVNTGATLDLGNTSQTIGAWRERGGELGVGDADDGGERASTEFGGVIGGSGGLVKMGLGTFTLTGPNSYTGGTTVAMGTLALDRAGSLAGIVGVQHGSDAFLWGGDRGEGWPRRARSRCRRRGLGCRWGR